MEHWNRIKIAKCQILITNFFVLVTRKWNRSGWAGGQVGSRGNNSPCPGPLALWSPLPRHHSHADWVWVSGDRP